MNSMEDEKIAWTNVRMRLDQSYGYDEIWEEAIQIFNNRLRKKFFSPIQIIINDRSKNGEGFAIMTVQCAIIETLAAFRKGMIFNHNNRNGNPAYEYKSSRKIFTEFLLSASIFKDHFWSLDITGAMVPNNPFNSIDFYSDVRCALMHEARTKNNWHINLSPKKTDSKNESKFIVTKNGKIKIYRTLLHYRLLNYFMEYQNELRQNNQDGEILRKYFARKMDSLFEVVPDVNFDWWN